MFTRLLAACSLLTTTMAVEAGFAVSVHEDILKASKKVLINYMKQMLTNIKFQDFDIDFLGKEHISDLRF